LPESETTDRGSLLAQGSPGVLSCRQPRTGCKAASAPPVVRQIVVPATGPRMRVEFAASRWLHHAGEGAVAGRCEKSTRLVRGVRDHAPYAVPSTRGPFTQGEGAPLSNGRHDRARASERHITRCSIDLRRTTRAMPMPTETEHSVGWSRPACGFRCWATLDHTADVGDAPA
jgi:hypothetical protein